jgi:hypothetical protein
MNEAEKTAFRRFYALQWWERDGGFEGDVTAAEIQVRRPMFAPFLGACAGGVWRLCVGL